MLTFIKNILSAQRIARELATAKAKVVTAESRLSEVLEHATAGAFTYADHPMDTLKAAISSVRNYHFNEGIEEGIRRAANNLTHYCEAERKVLDAMLHEVGRKLATIATETGLTDIDVKAIVRVFMQRGLAEFGTLYDDDGMLAGRGYCLTDKGLALQVQARRRAMAAG